ncbi:MAG: beta-ketoacyl-[acyl-carrier-protein] synthase family protein [Phycisphaerae bacterium]|nr:beta-ketoacyl-[acyl-carrier-protein] synthase family protein [Phycisphaerae bacterium]NIP54775.1 beta-ketoacyl-[acyl-carrier-protein] synthase family protein [Phycisphaerae bacterium]NIS50487.1 beta-ketoacyl-[acyl-carrier-protein] synthase family protein [Phycisphaerae bacterium]NIU11092.1 beta-ketoacyl-[acyl-carrier-protein] synthase family protein [Phycisphaerae bacterium]NIU58978.1 beta-ketoacyl-[acyl-carrier-protein] synthase family protein [Phycisphaerae bacterium]
MNPARVVITGLGAITPLGLTVSDMWSGLCAGKSGIAKIRAFDPVGYSCKLAGEVPDYKIRDYLPKSRRKSVKLMSRDIELAIIAANEALTGSGLITQAIDPENINIEPSRMAINLGAGLISCDLIEISPAIAASLTDGKFDIHKWGKIGLELVTPLWLLKYLPNMLACHIGIIHDIQGPSNTITCAEASAHLAIAEAAQIIERGDGDIALAGGAEAKVNPIVMIRQCLLNRSTSEHENDPAAACRPFDADAAGSVFGEGAGIVVLENAENARKRGAKIYAEVVGVGGSNNINPSYECLEPDGKGIQIAIEKALADAQIGPKDLDLIIPHGLGIAADDSAEAKAIEAVLGESVAETHVFPTKSMISTTGAASGALDVIAAAYAITEGKIPAAKNCDKKADGCNLNIVKETKETKINYALCCSYTYGGQTAAVVLKKADNA